MIKDLKEFGSEHYALVISSMAAIVTAGAGIVCLFYNKQFVEFPVSKILLISAIPTLPLCILNFLFASKVNAQKPTVAIKWVVGAFMTAGTLYVPLFLCYVFSWPLKPFILMVVVQEILLGFGTYCASAAKAK